MEWFLNKNCLKYIEDAYDSLSLEDKKKVLASSDTFCFNDKSGEIIAKE